MVVAKVGTRQHEINMTAERCGEDICVTLCGGELPHIGAVSMAVYEAERKSATTSTITAFCHRDDTLASAAAKYLSSVLCCTVTVSAGVHIDNATPADLEKLVKNAELCWNKIAKMLMDRPAENLLF